MRSTILAVGFALAVAGPAFAQTNHAQSPNAQRPEQNVQQQNLQSPRRNGQTLREQVQSNLKAAGFTNITIMPESFLVRAKDESGNPVMMAINPGSITAVTEIPQRNGSSSTTGSAPNAQRPQQNAQPPRPNAQTFRQEVQNNLKAAGFTDIRMMPESFLVRANDKSGNPVVMVINPDSIAAVTEIRQPNGSGSTTGSAPSDNSSNANNNRGAGSQR